MVVPQRSEDGSRLDSCSVLLTDEQADTLTIAKFEQGLAVPPPGVVNICCTDPVGRRPGPTLACPVVVSLFGGVAAARGRGNGMGAEE